MLDLSIVVISWKMRELLRQLLLSIKEQTKGVSYELIVVDNNSQDGTADMVRTLVPDAVLIRNFENRGVAPARNQGFSKAKGRYIVTLDADMVLRENSLKAMTDFMDATPDAGICSCKLVFPDNAVQLNARRFPTPMSFAMRRLDFLSLARQSKVLRDHEMAEWDRSDTRAVDYVIGACQMIRKEAMEKVGMLDENIFYGPEDVDFCLRMNRGGWKVYYFPYTSIIHYEQRITKKKLFSKLSWMHLKGVIYLFMKYRGRLTKN